MSEDNTYLRVFDIQRLCTNDGPGIRSTVFLKGCFLKCLWCHNPESIGFEIHSLRMEKLCKNCGACKMACPEGAIDEGLISDPEKCRGCGKCVMACVYGARKMCGEDMSIKCIADLLLRDQSYYEESGGGVTISGGEPLYQVAGVTELIICLKRYGLNVALDTTAFIDSEKFKKILELTDILLIDLKHMDDEKHKMLTGVGNSIILKNIRLASATDKKVIIRYPMIKELNDDITNIEEMQSFLASIGINSIDVIPYHDIGIGKYKALGRSFIPIKEYSDDEIAKKLKYMKLIGLQAKII